jgi:hypothetical protein
MRPTARGDGGFTMPRRGKWLVSIFLGFLLVLPSASAETSNQHKKPKGRKASKQQVVLPPAPVGPLPQVPLDQLPAAPPQVNFQNGRLSILAQNSTLGDILREVRKRTGASIEIPANATERVVASLGPAPPRDVLAALLNGTSFNYVMVGSVADPMALSSVVLSARPAGGGAQTVAEASQPAPVYSPPDRTELGPGMRPGGFLPRVQPVTPQPNPQAANGDDNADDQDAEDSDQDEADNQDQNGGTPQPNAGPKTPDQILQMLQKQQQQQPGPPPQPNPQN